MAQPPDDNPVVVSLLAVPESTPATLYGLYEVFSSVGTTWSELTGEPVACRRMAAQIVAPARETFSCAIGLPITPQASLDETPRTDIAIVTDLTLGGLDDPRGRWPAAADWLRRQYEGGATVCSVCTGTILLADAGLLDGLEATTHWSASDIFRRHYPEIRLRPERILMPDGFEHRIVTGGGASSWEDLALYLIGRFCGEAEAVRAAKIFVFGDRSEGQAAYAAMGQARRHDDAVIAECQSWIADHYVAGSPVARMVERSGLPERTFKRRFRAATGYSPVEYVQALRIEEAKQILETTGDPTDAVAHQVGYDDPAFFRSLFKRKTGVTPARYRQRFQSVAQLHRLGGRGGQVQ
jgi:transcriptional regulator GlxA family with amidase domain